MIYGSRIQARHSWRSLSIVVRYQHGAWGFPGVPVVKNLPANCRRHETWVWSLGWEDLLEKEMATHYRILPENLPEKFHGESLASYSPKCCKESDTAEHEPESAVTLHYFCHTVCYTWVTSLPRASDPTSEWKDCPRIYIYIYKHM